MIFGLPASAVDILVERARRSAGKVGGNEACINTVRSSLDAGDDALDPTLRRYSTRYASGTLTGSAQLAAPS